jgi:L,D-transpeptidase YcbB
VEHLLVDSSFFDSTLLCRRSITKFYTARTNRLFWSNGRSLDPAADSLLEILHEARCYGLPRENYHIEHLYYLLADSTKPNRLRQIDVYLTDSYLAFYNHLKRGRLDSKSYEPRDLSLDVDDEAISVLSSIAKTTVRKSLESSEPRFIQYRELKNALRKLIKQGGDSLHFNEINTLAINMERWRWQKPWPERYVLVNVPSYILRVVEADSLWLETNVIVGKRKTPTPVMESIINSFIIYPYWHVPRSISTKEILPHLQADAGYLHRNNFEVLDKTGKVILTDTIQWKMYSGDYFPFTLRQREGSENSMGIIKFNFANKYGVYLHGTNSKRLFELPKRDLSHGCVRVKNAVALAHYLIREDDIYVSPEDLDQYLSLRQRVAINLRDPIPLKLEYFTAEIINGRAAFYEDIYKKDSTIWKSWNPLGNETQKVADQPKAL